MVVHPTNVYLIKISGVVKHMNPDLYIQEASKGPGNRFCVRIGDGCSRSIGANRCTILAQRIIYLPKDHNIIPSKTYVMKNIDFKLLKRFLFIISFVFFIGAVFDIMRCTLDILKREYWTLLLHIIGVVANLIVGMYLYGISKKINVDES